MTLGQTELENLGFEYQGIFDTITRYKFEIERKDKREFDCTSIYWYEEDSAGIPQRLYGGIYGGLDYRQPTYDLLKTWNTIEDLEKDLKIYLEKDLTN